MLNRFILLFLALCCSGCQRADERQAHRNQTLLNEAELLLDSRRFDEARDHADQALDSLKELLSNRPEHLDMQLLQIRAYLVAFLAENTLIIENSKPQPQSLVQIPRPQAYIGYAERIDPAFKALVKLANSKQEMSHEQRAFVHDTLAAIFRLKTETAGDAIREYQTTLNIYDRWLRELKNPKKKIGSNTFAIQKVKNLIRATLMAQAEAHILAESWEPALASLKTAIAGDDLKYFALHFTRLENRKSILEAKVTQEELRSNSTRQRRLLSMVKDRVAKRGKKVEEMAGYSPYEAELLFTRSELVDLQNNLSYRILCLQRLGRFDEVKAARQVLREYYPELDAEIGMELKID